MLPTSSGYDKVKFRVSIHDSDNNESFDVFCSAYFYNTSNIYYASAYIIANPSASRDFAVRFGYDSSASKWCVWIGELASTWVTPMVAITDVQVGYAPIASYTSGWIISTETSFDTVLATVTGTQIT